MEERLIVLNRLEQVMTSIPLSLCVQPARMLVELCRYYIV